MNNVLQIVENEQKSEFYPTPKALAEKMIDGIDWTYVHTVLEPSAGKGDILRVIAQLTHTKYIRHELDIDCIEIDPNLRQILKYNFSDDRKRELRNRESEVEPRKTYNSVTRQYDDVPRTHEQKLEYQYIKTELDTFFERGIHIIHDDFLTYNPFKTYDLIIMNPPFSNGDRHLLKALKLQEKGGNIICLLNAETLKNPYTETRRALLEQLNKHNAQIEYIENAFVSAERQTSVEIALIKIHIEQVQEESDIYNHFKKAENYEDIYEEITDLEVSDYIKAAINRFNIEVKAGIELIRQYRAMIPYISRSFGEDSWDKTPILRLSDGSDRGYGSVSINEFVKVVRLKYWKALLQNPKFIGRLTSKLQQEYREQVNKLANYDFTEFNISILSAEMNTKIKQGIEEEIIAMFDRLTSEHSWYPETQKNRHYYDGWATNKAHKIDKKVIIPCYGVFDSWDGKPRTYEAQHVLEDIERILNFLDGGMTEEVNSWSFLDYNFKRGITKNIHQKYYTATFYKKGTVHLTFTCPELIERFNIYAAQNKKWLPPNYGKKAYKNMTEEEKKVIDSFQGEEAYKDVMSKAGYYLAPVTNNTMSLLTEGESI